ncbi:hypothetical protein T265_03395 [Opisthorchis viverrini]|uniref:Uncharacterized protein n=1 Tax=Opisthorchis viverrini TaxID=6198 RepID=A0A075AHM3_OPIVI|nr:hypothetical protein T265_03395 [Opisthorchis viverrini]KER30134.1 hypothetical protein T265_03395 [Opisthorchis viverrini]
MKPGLTNFESENIQPQLSEQRILGNESKRESDDLNYEAVNLSLMENSSWFQITPINALTPVILNMFSNSAMENRVCWVNGEKPVCQALFKQNISENQDPSEATVLQGKEIKRRQKCLVVHGLEAGNHFRSGSLGDAQ